MRVPWVLVWRLQQLTPGGTSAQIEPQLEQLFRRALVNILIGNQDDHLRNHGFLHVGNGWALLPTQQCGHPPLR